MDYSKSPRVSGWFPPLPVTVNMGVNGGLRMMMVNMGVNGGVRMMMVNMGVNGG